METWIAYISAAVVIVGVSLTLWSRFREHRENSRGWRIGFEPVGIRYEEKKKDGAWVSLVIRGTPRGHGLGALLIPTDAVWDSRYPDWARGRREEILSRVKSESEALPFLEEAIQPPQTTTGSCAPSRV
jgi:hypothetical protein